MNRLRSFILILSWALVALAGCNRDGGAPMPPGGERVVVNFQGSITRSPADGSIESLDLMAFRTSDGSIDAVGRSYGESGISISLSCGTALTIYILANSAEGALEGISSLEDFLESETFLEESSAKPVMYDCRKTPGLSPEDNGKSINFELRRYIAKVSLDTISVPWLEEFDPMPSCRIGRIALVNAKGSTARGGDSPIRGSLWYNCSDVDAPDNVADMLVDSAGKTVESTQPVTCSTTLYTMPNPYENEAYYGNGPWSPRRSRLAIELIVDGVSQWYPLTLPALEGNCHYSINNVKITGPGASHPDAEIIRNSIGFTISLTPWTDSFESIEFNNNQI